jgi:hypothetical protein
MGQIISIVSENAFVFYSKLKTICSRKKEKKLGDSFNETPNESLLSENINEEPFDNIKVKLIIEKPNSDYKKIPDMKNEYLLLKNTDDNDYKRNDIDIENLTKEINEINIIVDEKNSKPYIQNDHLDVDSLEDLKRQIFDKNEYN